MAHFNLSHDNSRGNTVSVSEPTQAHIRGWYSGVNVEARNTPEGDVFYVWMTTGSHQSQVNTLLGVVRTFEYSPVFVAAENGRLPE